MGKLPAPVEAGMRGSNGNRERLPRRIRRRPTSLRELSSYSLSTVADEPEWVKSVSAPAIDHQNRRPWRIQVKVGRAVAGAFDVKPLVFFNIMNLPTTHGWVIEF